LRALVSRLREEAPHNAAAAAVLAALEADFPELQSDIMEVEARR